MDIRTYLQTKKIITDGSFGTYYMEGYDTNEMPEYANTEYPERVMKIHREYIEAGAGLIRTNTFADNTHSLDKDWEYVKRNIHAAVSLAKEAVKACGRDVYIAGDIGPIPFRQGVNPEQIEAEYEAIVRTFLEDGIDILTFETFPDAEMIGTVIDRICKDESNPPFVMVQFSVNQFGYSSSGLSAGKLLRDMASNAYVDAVGLNCGIGPGHMGQIYDRISRRGDIYYIALPNAGYPKRIRNRVEFENNPAYFAEKMCELAGKGIDIVGGCCGTNPVFIKQLYASLDFEQKHIACESKPDNIESGNVHPVFHGFLYEADSGRIKQDKYIAVELAPPVNADDGKILEAARMLKNMNVDVVTFPDSPSGRTRVDSVLMAAKIKEETGLNVMPHICCRDKNAIAMRSMLLGAHINEIYNMLIMTGDPIPSLARESTKAVFNFDSVGLMRIVKEMNDDVFPESPISYGGVINQGRRNLDIEISRVRKKMDAGAEFFLTQPTFCREDAERIRQIKEETGARILCGIMPLISRKNALFMKNEIAGVPVTDEVIERYNGAVSREEGEAVGVTIAKEMMAYTADYVDGYYFSFPFNRVYLLQQIMEDIE